MGLNTNLLKVKVSKNEMISGENSLTVSCFSHIFDSYVRYFIQIDSGNKNHIST